jgi:L-threonylcarbamoyladenylate synthase
MMEEEIRKALEALRTGGTILCPTDTIWGISCDATSKEAVEKIYAVKERDPSKSLIVLVDDEKWLNKYLKEVPAMAWDLIEMSEKPLTIIYDDARGLAPNAIAADGSVAIRVCRDEFLRRLIHKFGKPIVSTSANISGRPSPSSFSEIDERVLAAVDHVVNWRQEERGHASASSIIRIKLSGEVKVIRK